MTPVHHTRIDDGSLRGEFVVQAHCDCGWEGPRRNQTNANLLAQEDAWDHIDCVQRAMNDDRLAPAA